MLRSSVLLLSMHVLSTCACRVCVRSVSTHTCITVASHRLMQHCVWLTKGYLADALLSAACPRTGGEAAALLYCARGTSAPSPDSRHAVAPVVAWRAPREVREAQGCRVGGAGTSQGPHPSSPLAAAPTEPTATRGRAVKAFLGLHNPDKTANLGLMACRYKLGEKAQVCPGGSCLLPGKRPKWSRWGKGDGP